MAAPGLRLNVEFKTDRPVVNRWGRYVPTASDYKSPVVRTGDGRRRK